MPLKRIDLKVGEGGLEPPTSALSEPRSNQLSYSPAKCEVILPLLTREVVHFYCGAGFAAPAGELSFGISLIFLRKPPALIPAC